MADAFLDRFDNADIEERGVLLAEMKKTRGGLLKTDQKRLRNTYRKEMVKRPIAWKISAAWVIAVPASGRLAALIYFTIRGMMLPA